ncbi:S1 RNA-binding domain-containing protein [Murdochiella vaginalis]|uniref:CvfB family protein n=1 Tax=Murdochiella vaginalis TaxID=1852373 RepID=UPI0008FDA029|nr:S1-like domain-containing RNA-binding protein [Murdochiella vaginalis]
MQLGTTQTLKIQSITPPGAILQGNILLPKRFVPEGAKVGENIEVFLLRDSEDRPIATTRRPKVQVGELALLTVKDVSRQGAFLDWGLDKDLFLPFQEQMHHVKPGEAVLIYCYLDKSERLCSTMRVKNRFAFPEELHENDWVEGVVYANNPDIGAFVLVEQKYNGLIPADGTRGALRIGQSVRARVERIKADGKIDLSLQSRTHEQMDTDAITILRMVQANNGFLRVNDHSDPETIRMLFGMSKAQFKRCIGRLLKQKRIVFCKDGIALPEQK